MVHLQEKRKLFRRRFKMPVKGKMNNPEQSQRTKAPNISSTPRNQSKGSDYSGETRGYVADIKFTTKKPRE